MNVTRTLAGLCRWTARVVGVLQVCLIAAIAIGQGVPNPLKQPAPVLLGFFALALTIGGILLAWWREPIGGAISLAGFCLFVGAVVSPRSPSGFIASLGLPGALFLASSILRLDTETDSATGAQT